MSAIHINGITGCGSATRNSKQSGIALITSLLMLVIMTLLALSMFHGISLDESIAGNTREKQRSLQSAESALEYGEWWLSQGTFGAAISCTAVYKANTVANMQVCNTTLTNPTNLPWAARGDYLPPTMTVATEGGVVASSTTTGIAGDINYYAEPSLYIAALPPNGNSQLYQVTAAGYGGNANSVSVVQSVYAYTPNINSLDNP